MACLFRIRGMKVRKVAGEAIFKDGRIRHYGGLSRGSPLPHRDTVPSSLLRQTAGTASHAD